MRTVNKVKSILAVTLIWLYYMVVTLFFGWQAVNMRVKGYIPRNGKFSVWGFFRWYRRRP